MDLRSSSSSFGYSRPAGSPSSGFRSQSWSRSGPSSSLTSASTLTSTYKRSLNAPVSRSAADAGGDYSRSSSEKEQLQGLNDRFVVYIDKVHFLEQQNQQVEAEIQALRQQQVSRSQLGELYDQELQELRTTLERIHHDKAQAQLDSEHLDEEARRLRERLDEEARVREETEAAVRALKRDAGDSGLLQAELEKKVQALQDELGFLRSSHEEEVAELLAHIQEAQVSVERRGEARGGAADVTEALRDIRSELEDRGQQQQRQVEAWFQGRCAQLSEAAERNQDAIRSARDDIAEQRRLLASKSAELEAVRGARDSLERQLSDVEDRHNGDLAGLQVRDGEKFGNLG